MTSRVRLAALLGGATVAICLVVLVVARPPAALWPLFARDQPSDLAGEPAPPVTKPPAVRVAVAGDTGTGDPSEADTARQMAAQGRTRPYDALLLLGDLVYEDGEAKLTDRVVTEPFEAVLRGGATLLPVLGNHDYASGEQQQILEELGRREAWYVQRIGQLRVVVLDSNQVSNPVQTQWLRETLAVPQPTDTWTVAAMHHPGYSAGYHGSDLEVREAWGPLFAEYDVPLVLAGHDHDYQRSTPQDGVTYVVSGAGAKLRPTGSEDFTAVSASVLHYVDLLVYADRLVMSAIDQTGTLVDTFTIDR
ncbi:MAG: metallophosphoesterase family protein [Nocardioides sp.]